MNENKHFEAFGKPFPVTDVGWKIQRLNKSKTAGMVVPYLDARAISDRLDEVVGQYNWKDEYGQWHCYVEEPKDEGKKPKKIFSQLCTIYIYDEDRKEWIGKTDGAENTDFESIKGGLSDSYKRAAVKWNIGRYMYNFKPVWVSVENEYGREVIAESEYSKLEKIYTDIVERLFGKDALKSLQQNSSKTGTKSKSEVYEIKNVQVDGEGQDVKSRIVLNDGKTDNTMFMYGSDPKLKRGTKITNLKGKQKTTSYGTYLILEKYDIAA